MQVGLGPVGQGCDSCTVLQGKCTGLLASKDTHRFNVLRYDHPPSTETVCVLTCQKPPVKGYLAYKKMPYPGTLPLGYAHGPMTVLKGGEAFTCNQGIPVGDREMLDEGKCTTPMNST